ncbi:MAG: hypothetical protein QNJ91_15755, partial [Gammaproteobacteria bacterium]|nr:hypothetical protein [Gammaproteobacteria bacterium]
MNSKTSTGLALAALTAVSAPSAAGDYRGAAAAAAAPAAGYGYPSTGAMPFRAPGHGWYRPGFAGYKPMPPAYGYLRPMYRPPHRHAYAPMRPPMGGYAQTQPAPAVPPQVEVQAEMPAEAAV